MLGFFTGLVYANAWEWMIHKYLLHEEGRKKDSFWRFHYMEHHKNCRLNDNLDPDYDRNLLEWNAQSKEVVTLLGGAALHLPLLPIAPTFTLGVWTSMTYYYFAHKKCHQDSDWGRKNMPWHYDHHMGKNQDANWGVTFPLFDHILGTRIPYVGTEEELADREKRLEKMKVRQMKASVAGAAA